MRNSGVTDLLRLLMAEQAAIITGQYAKLDEIVPKKLTLFDQIHHVEIHKQDLREIADCLAQNKRLLTAALNGIRAARDRLETLNKVRTGLQVYDQSGQLATAIMQRPDIVKKA